MLSTSEWRVSSRIICLADILENRLLLWSHYRLPGWGKARSQEMYLHWGPLAVPWRCAPSRFFRSTSNDCGKDIMVSTRKLEHSSMWLADNDIVDGVMASTPPPRLSGSPNSSRPRREVERLRSKETSSLSALSLHTTTTSACPTQPVQHSGEPPLRPKVLSSSPKSPGVTYSPNRRDG